MLFKPGSLDNNGNVIPDDYYALSSKFPEKGYYIMPFFDHGVVSNIKYMSTTESGKIYLEDVWGTPVKNVEGTEVDCAAQPRADCY